MDSRSDNIINSPRIVQGDGSKLIDNSIHIGRSFNERQERIAVLDEVIAKLRNTELKKKAKEKAERSLPSVRDELAEGPRRNPSTVHKSLETTKNSLKTAALGFELTEAVQKPFTIFRRYPS